jgi:hypothetical protein
VTPPADDWPANASNIKAKMTCLNDFMGFLSSPLVRKRVYLSDVIRTVSGPLWIGAA